MIGIPGKIPIYIHPFFWLLATFIGWMYTQTFSGTMICVLVIMLSLLIHEFGHALTALFFGQEARVHLVAFGGLTTRTGKQIKLWQEFCVVIMGPIAGLSAFVLGLFIRPLLPDLPPLSALALSLFIFINLYWNVLNLLPILPLDGGRLMSITLEGAFGFRGFQFSLIFSVVLAVVFAILLFYAGLFVAGALVLLFALEGFRDFQASQKMSPADRDPAVQDLMQVARDQLKDGRVADAIRNFQEVRDRTGYGYNYIEAGIQIADLLAKSGDIEKAHTLLRPLKEDLPPDAMELFHQLAFQMGEWKEAIEAGMRSYQWEPSYQKAFVVALCHARIQDTKATIGWLSRAQRDGMPNLLESLQRAEFDEMRTDQDFMNFRVSLESSEAGGHSA